jgi:DNA-directed RNA polymerase subunit E'/Rpb7
MILERIFDVSITVSNTISFCANIEKNCLTTLNNMYVGKCYKNSYIIEINNIIKHSCCRIISTNSTGYGIIDVKFSANIYIFSKRDILAGVVIEKNADFISSVYKKYGANIHCVIVLTEEQKAYSSLLQANQVIPLIRIEESLHIPMYDKISAVGKILTCEKEIRIHKIEGNIKPENMKKIKIYLNEMKKELNRRNEYIKTKKDKIYLFESLLYYYNECPKDFITNKYDEYIWNGPNFILQKGKTETFYNIFELIEKNENFDGFWTRPFYVHRSSPILVKDSNTYEEYTSIEAHNFILCYINIILNYVRAINEVIEIYNEDDPFFKKIQILMKNEQKSV